MIKVMAAVAALGWAAGAAAAPTYLECKLQREGAVSIVEIVADEDNHSAVIALPATGRTVTRQAVFSPTTVRISDDPEIWIVDRVSLKLVRDMKIGDEVSRLTGTCSLKPKPDKRAF
jgi:hypothetical protein